MNSPNLLTGIFLGIVSVSGHAASYVTSDTQFDDGKTDRQGDPKNRFEIVGVKGIGTKKVTMSYRYSIDLSLLGGSGKEAVEFDVVYSVPRGAIPSGRVLGAASEPNPTDLIDSGEQVSAKINFKSSTFLKGVRFANIQMWGKGDAKVGDEVKTEEHCRFSVMSDSFTVRNVDKHGENFAIGYVSFVIDVDDTAPVPALPQASLITISGMSLNVVSMQ